MSRFSPFQGVRYDGGEVELGDVVAPPYDVIDEPERALLESRSPYNAVRVELARDLPGVDRHQSAAALLREWLDRGVLRPDSEPGFYVYGMGWRDDGGNPRQTTGVVGALAVSPPEAGEVLAHERTMAKPLGDRLDLLRACRANLSPIWCLAPVDGLSSLLRPEGPPVARCTDDGGVHHRLWRITRPAVVEAISRAVEQEPLVIADGHHRYQTALAYRGEHPDDPGASRVMAFVVALEADQLGVHPIHRVVSGDLPARADLLASLGSRFELDDAGMLAAADDSGGVADDEVDKLLHRMAEVGAFALLYDGRAWLVRPRTGEDDRPDSAHVEDALVVLGRPDVAYHHSAPHVASVVAGGHAAAGFLLRPVTVDQIAAVARAHGRMPEKTTFFAPKPRTGLVFRLLDLP